MKKTLLIILVLAIVGFVAYTFLGKDKEVTDGLVSNKTNTAKVGVELLADLATLDTLKLDTDFFKDATFRRLVNFSKDIPVQPKGRSNPFAPIGASVGASLATSTNAR